MTTTTAHPAAPAPTVAPARRFRVSGLAGTRRMIGMVLRRDRLLLPVWALCVAMTGIGAASAVATTYPTRADVLARYDQVHEISMFLLFQSKPFAATPEGLVAQQAFGAVVVFASIGAALLAVRHTRAEERAGRLELVRAMPVGHAAPLAAAVVVLLGAGILVGATIAAGLLAQGLPAAGSTLLGLVAAGATWVGAATGVVLAQITQSARAAGVSALVACYLFHYLRGIGHVLDDAAWLTWTLPFGWLEAARPFAGERWWLLGPVAAWAGAVIALAFTLSARRDLGEGLVPERRGRATASGRLTGVAAMAWRQNRASFAVWAAVTVLLGIVFGSGGTAAVEDYADSPVTADFATGLGIDDPAQVFFVYVVFLYVFVAAIHAVLVTLRLRGEETSGTAELLLAGPVSRVRWAAATVAAALAGSAALLVLLGVSLTVMAPQVPGVLTMTVSLIPPVWVYVAVVTAAFGLVPRATTAIAWSFLALGIAAEILVKAGLPDWVYVAASPIAQANPYYTTPWSWPALLALAAGLIAVGLAGIRRRDLPR